MSFAIVRQTKFDPLIKHHFLPGRMEEHKSPRSIQVSSTDIDWRWWIGSWEKANRTLRKKHDPASDQKILGHCLTHKPQNKNFILSSIFIDFPYRPSNETLPVHICTLNLCLLFHIVKILFALNVNKHRKEMKRLIDFFIASKPCELNL